MNIKKIVSSILVLSVCAGYSVYGEEQDDISVFIDGYQLAFDVPPQIVNDRTVVPMRAIFESLGATVDWNADTRTVYSVKGSDTISLRVDDPAMVVNNSTIALDTAPCIIDDRTLVPVRAISEAFGMNVSWDGEIRSVLINSNSLLADGAGQSGPIWTKTKNDTTVTANTYIKRQSGAVINEKRKNMYSTDYIEVPGGSSLKLTLQNVTAAINRGLAYYDENRSYISGFAFKAVKESTTYSLKVPGNARYMRFTFFGDFNLVLEKLAEPEIINDPAVPADPAPNTNTSTKAGSDGLSFVLPNKLYGVAGHPINIYLDNILKNGNYDQMYRMWISGDSGCIVDGEYEYTPKEALTRTPTIYCYKSGESLTLSKALPYKVYQPYNGAAVTKKILMLGDSTTQNAAACRSTLTKLFSENTTAKIEFVGTKQDDNKYAHEGRGGWTAKEYNTAASHGSNTNPFYNASLSTDSKFDFAYYITNHPSNVPDIVTVNLGINDVTAKTEVSDIISYIDSIVSSIKSYDSSITVIVATPNLPSSLSGEWTSLNLRKTKLQELISAVMSKYQGREGEKIYMAPLYIGINTKWDMPYTEKKVNSRSDKTVYAAADGTHPAKAGYEKMGDQYYNLINAILCGE